MTPKQIRYSIHAAAQLRERKITREEVRWLLAHGIPEPNRPGVWTRRGYIGKTEYMMFYVESQTGIYVITVEPVE